jgi:protein O-mannosyl-transferase
LSLIHEFPLSTGLFHPITTVVSWLALLAVVVIALARARTNRLFSFAVFWYLGSLAVESLPLPIDIVFEHRLYLALLSVLVPVCAGPVLKGKSLKYVLPLALAVALFFGYFTFCRNQVWASDDALWEDVVQKSPNSAEAYNNRGLDVAAKGQQEIAIREFSKAIELKPHYAEAYSNLGSAYAAQDRIDQAISAYGKAIELDPKLAPAYNNRCGAYNEQRKFDLAIADCGKAIELVPEYAEAYFYRGLAYGNQGQNDLGIRDFSKTIELNPDDAQAFYNRAISYTANGQKDLANKDFARAIELDPKLAEQTK